jgi:hypothetical protein
MCIYVLRTMKEPQCQDKQRKPAGDGAKIHRSNACEIQSGAHHRRVENEGIKRARVLQFLVQALARLPAAGILGFGSSL